MAELEYPFAPIGSLDALARHLGMSRGQLEDAIAGASGRLAYRVRKVTASDVRGVPDKVEYAPAPWLKELQRTINRRLLRAVEMPVYVIGGVSGRRIEDAIRRHAYSQALLSFDVSRFYESTDAAEVRKVFMRLFHFPPEVTDALLVLTTYRDRLPRGAPTSSYLANLVLFDVEPGLVDWLSGLQPRALRYSRWVDDINISSPRPIDKLLADEVKDRVSKMLRRHGLSMNRTKYRQNLRAKSVVVHHIRIEGNRFSVAGSKRRNVRAAVHNLELASQKRMLSANKRRELIRLRSRIEFIRRFHPREMEPLRIRLKAINEGQPGHT